MCHDTAPIYEYLEKKLHTRSRNFGWKHVPGYGGRFYPGVCWIKPRHGNISRPQDLHSPDTWPPRKGYPSIIQFLYLLASGKPPFLNFWGGFNVKKTILSVDFFVTQRADSYIEVGRACCSDSPCFHRDFLTMLWRGSRTGIVWFEFISACRTYNLRLLRSVWPLLWCVNTCVIYVNISPLNVLYLVHSCHQIYLIRRRCHIIYKNIKPDVLKNTATARQKTIFKMHIFLGYDVKFHKKESKRAN